MAIRGEGYREPLMGPNEDHDVSHGIILGQDMAHARTAVTCSSSSSEGSESDWTSIESSDDEDDSDEPTQQRGVSDAAAAKSLAPPSVDKSLAVDRWMKAGKVVRQNARLKLSMQAMLGETRKTRAMAESERSYFLFKLFMLVVTLSVLDTETKAVAFHLSAVGIYSSCTLTSATANGADKTFDGASRTIRYGDITPEEQSAYGISSCAPYKFSYSLFVTLVVFFVKLTLGPLKAMVRNKEIQEVQEKEDRVQEKKDRVQEKKDQMVSRLSESQETPERQESNGSEVSSCRTASHRRSRSGTGGRSRSMTHVKTRGKKQAMTVARAFRELRMLTQLAGSAKAKVMPWVLLFGFTFMEMLSTSLANYALNLTPTSIYIVFKSSKMVFVAIGSRFLLGTKLRWAQWSALVLLVLALLVSVVAEKAPSKHGGATLRGPILLLASEMCHALMLIMQQVAVQSYWPEPMMLVSASAALGMPMTLLSMIAAHKMVTPYSPHHPVSDWRDVFVMCSTSMTLSVSLVAHMVFHVAMDVNHITALKHMSSLTRSLCDAVKLGAMWTIGKLCWFAGDLIWQADWPSSAPSFLAVLAEPWRPNSWMMIPALIVIAYAMLMFKFAVFAPIRFQRSDDGTWQAQLAKYERTEEERQDPFQKVDVGLDDAFYSAAFTNRKCRHAMKQNLKFAFMADGAKPANRFQAAMFKIRKAGDDNSAGGVQAGSAK